jgi:NhaP-type Na+/H+ or K+/H+ antiporter
VVTVATAVLPMGVLLPDSILRNELIAVLAAFVAINTIVYVTLAVAKMLPKLYIRDYLSSRNRRAETRSIDPDAPV